MPVRRRLARGRPPLGPRAESSHLRAERGGGRRAHHVPPGADRGERNWDYWFTWIRDATLTLISLFILGYVEEADAVKGWLENTGAGRPEDLQIMYGIGGERFLPEIELAHLAGHRGSAPVRVGNAAVKQLQLDAYGQILEAAYL